MANITPGTSVSQSTGIQAGLTHQGPQYDQPNTYRPLRVYGKEIKEVKVGSEDRMITHYKVDDGTIYTAQEVANAIGEMKAEGLQVVQGATTDSLVIRSVRDYAQVPLSALPHFY